MDERVLIALFVLVGAVIAMVAVWQYMRASRRRQDLLALALRLGWSFDSRERWADDPLYTPFQVFKRGHTRRAYNTICGDLEVEGRFYPAAMGDFSYKITSGSGKNRRTRTYHFSYMVIRLPFGQMPDLVIRQENLLDKLAGFFGWPDINFESAEFSRRFHVNSRDRRFAYDLVHPKMMEFLLATSPPMIDIERGRLCVSDGRGCWSIDQFDRRVIWMTDFLRLWPAHLIDRLESTPSTTKYV